MLAWNEYIWDGEITKITSEEIRSCSASSAVSAAYFAAHSLSASAAAGSSSDSLSVLAPPPPPLMTLKRFPAGFVLEAAYVEDDEDMPDATVEDDEDIPDATVVASDKLTSAELQRQRGRKRQTPPAASSSEDLSGLPYAIEVSPHQATNFGHIGAVVTGEGSPTSTQKGSQHGSAPPTPTM